MSSIPGSVPCSMSLRLLGSLRGSLGIYGLTQKLFKKKYYYVCGYLYDDDDDDDNEYMVACIKFKFVENFSKQMTGVHNPHERFLEKKLSIFSGFLSNVPIWLLQDILRKSITNSDNIQISLALLELSQSISLLKIPR